MAAVRAHEPGCLLYMLSRRTSAPSVFMERYAVDAALAAQRGTEHFKIARSRMGAHLEGLPVVLRMTELG